MSAWQVVMAVGGLVFVAMGVVGLVAPHLGERPRKRAAIVGTRPTVSVLTMLAGALWVVAAVLNTRWIGWAGMAVLVVSGVLAKRWMAEIDDPPPMIARMRDRSLNPLAILRHPIRETEANLEVFRLGRNRREHREWEVRRGIRPPDPGSSG